MVGEDTKEKSIHHDQHLDLIYSQLGTLYDIIMNTPQPSTDRSNSKLRPHVDGVVGFSPTTTIGQLAGKLGQMTISRDPSLFVPLPNPSPSSSQTFEVHIVQTTSSRQLGGKNKNKGKSKKSSAKQGCEQTQQTPTEGSKNKCKFKYPCMICKEDKFMKYYPYLTKVHQYIE